MPSDSEHPMQKPLRGYAERRRADAGEPALHPANRRLLQAEVARQFPARPAPTSLLSWLGRLWPRLAFAAAVCLAVGFVLWNAVSDRAGRGHAPTMARLDSASDRKFNDATDKPAASSAAAPMPLLQPPEASPAPRETERMRGRPVALAETDPLTRVAPAASEAKAPAAVPPPTPRLAMRGAQAPRPPQDALLKESPTTTRSYAVSAPSRGSTEAAAPATGDRLQTGAAVALGGAARTEELNAVGAQGKVEGRSLSMDLSSARAPAPLAVVPSPPAPSPLESEGASRRALPGTPSTPPSATAFRVRGLPGEAPPSLATVPDRQSYRFAAAPTQALSFTRNATVDPLASFEFERNGDRVWLFATDGSVYTGSVLATNRTFFRVAGTNRSHGRRVTVEGTFLQGTQALGRVGIQATPRFGGAPTPAGPAPSSAGAGASAELPTLPAGAALELRVRTEGMADQAGVAVPVARPAPPVPARPAPAGAGDVKR